LIVATQEQTMSARKFSAVAVVLTMLIVAAPAMADNLPAGSVGDILENCEAVSALSPTHTTIQMGLCLGFVNAVLQGWQLRNASGDNVGICMPVTLTNADVVAIFLSWGKSRSQSAQEATLGIFDALREKFSCKR
jgi:hypothetical protein